MKHIRKISMLIAAVIAFTYIATGCGSKPEGGKIINGSSVLPIASKVSQENTEAYINPNEIRMTGVLTYIDTSLKKLHFMDIESSSEYEVLYTGATDIKNKYETIISAMQLTTGRIFDVTCNKSGKALSIIESSDAWTNSSVTNFGVQEVEKTMTIGATTYRYNSSTVVVSGNDRLLPTQILPQDTITVRGIGKTIYSVAIDKGHGYIKLTGIENFIGGFVDVGRSTVYEVSDNMIITAPVGTHKITMQKGSMQGTKTIEVRTNEDSTLDFSEYVPEAVKTGMVSFSITPSNPYIYIDGTLISDTTSVQLTYGTHRITLKANNYETYTQLFTVNSAYDVLVIDMTGTSSATATTAADLTKGYTITIKEPIGAAVYIDNVYVGMSPVTVSKSSGRKVITLTKSGCTTKSYTIQVANTAGDLTYAFPNMESSVESASGSTSESSDK